MNASHLVCAGAVLVALGACAVEPTAVSTRPNAPAVGGVASEIKSPSAECEAALVLGVRPFAIIGARTQDYQLVRAENVLAGTSTCRGPGCWRLTYKERQSIPTSNPPEHPIGAGGELFVEVDLTDRTMRIGNQPMLPAQIEQMEALNAAGGEPSSAPTEGSGSPAVECRTALDLGVRVFHNLDARVQDYRLVRADNVLAGTATCPGPGCWRLTYKLRQLIPTSTEGRIGAGGEIFVEVDIAAGTARITGYGE